MYEYSSKVFNRNSERNSEGTPRNTQPDGGLMFEKQKWFKVPYKA